MSDLKNMGFGNRGNGTFKKDPGFSKVDEIFNKRLRKKFTEYEPLK